MEIDPRDPESLYLAGQQEFIAGEFSAAEGHLRKAIDLVPSAKAWHALGDTLISEVRFGDAAGAFREAVRLDPAKHLSWMRLGRCLINSGRNNEAVEAYRKAQALKTGDLVAAREEVEALLGAKRDEEAVSALEQIAAADPQGSVRDRVLLGQIQARQERWKDAVASLQGALALRPDADVYHQLGEALVRLGDLGGARDAFREAARQDPKDPFAWELVAEAEVKLGRPEAAGAAFEESLKVKDRPGPHLGLGRLAWAGRAAAPARVQLDAALAATTGESADEVREIAAFALQLGETGMAVKLLETLAAEPEGSKDAALLRELAGAYALARAAARGRAQVDLAKKVTAACERARAASPGDRSRCPPTGG